ncbi:GM19433 [Drosophila sechellia]|uniref:GM19433 n=1 Tax=Drosophila sechellia TaxID=7238 RepID=B4ID93_DROSE|nr:GM19433 [Drosophila sechellia]
MLNKPKRGAAESDVTTAGEGGGSGVERRRGLGGVLPLSVFRYPRRCGLQRYIEELSISFNLHQAIVTGNK